MRKRLALAAGRRKRQGAKAPLDVQGSGPGSLVETIVEDRHARIDLIPG